MKDGGYLIIDHSASPGIPEDIARQLHLDPRAVAEGRVMEAGTMTCAHCKCTVFKNPLRTRERGFCAKCYHYVCDICAFKATQPDYMHTPFEKVIDEHLAAANVVPGLILPSYVCEDVPDPADLVTPTSDCVAESPELVSDSTEQADVPVSSPPATNP